MYDKTRFHHPCQICSTAAFGRIARITAHDQMLQNSPEYCPIALALRGWCSLEQNIGTHKVGRAQRKASCRVRRSLRLGLPMPRSMSCLRFAENCCRTASLPQERNFHHQDVCQQPSPALSSRKSERRVPQSRKARNCCAPELWLYLRASAVQSD